MIDKRRATDTEKIQAGDYYDGNKRYYDQMAEVTVIKVFSGEWQTSDKPNEMMVTILGSCVSACIRDPVIGVGGMNHFLLPSTSLEDGLNARYGSFAMEELINAILKLGGRKDRLEVKVFGGGNVIKSSALIGDKNVMFVRKYLADEGIKIASEDLGGTQPRRLHYYPHSGKVMMRRLNRKEDFENVAKEEVGYQKNLVKTGDKGIGGDVELF